MQKLKLVRTEAGDNYVVSEYACDFIVQCAGDSIWGDTSERKVQVTAISVTDTDFGDFVSKMIYVTHNATWDIYTDSGFEKAISNALGYNVCFTEQGMQDNCVASLEKC